MFSISFVTRCLTWTLASVATAVAVSRGTSDDANKNKPAPPTHSKNITQGNIFSSVSPEHKTVTKNVKVPFDEKKAKELIADLDSPVYRVRKAASEELSCVVRLPIYRLEIDSGHRILAP